LLRTYLEQYNDTTEAALDGIHTIIKLCKEADTVRRVVYTGSVVACSPWKEDFTGYKDFIDESSWTKFDHPYPHYIDHLKVYLFLEKYTLFHILPPLFSQKSESSYYKIKETL
jgi:hypothetical protein